jgi:hypothetical protein
MLGILKASSLSKSLRVKRTQNYNFYPSFLWNLAINGTADSENRVLKRIYALNENEIMETGENFIIRSFTNFTLRQI